MAEMRTVSAATIRKTSVKERRSGSSTIMPLKARVSAPCADGQSHRVAHAVAARPMSESAAVARRCVRRVKASTSMTTMPVTERISSGSSSRKFTSGADGGIAKIRLIVLTLTSAARRLGRAGEEKLFGGGARLGLARLPAEQRVHTFAHHLL